MKLFENSTERERYENMADLYAIFVTMENLEKAFIRDNITAKQYTPACVKLIAQFKTGLNLLGNDFDMNEFLSKYKISFPAAQRRLIEIGVPATIEHSTTSTQETSTKHVAETVTHFITLMDSLKLQMVAVDQIHPLLSDLMQSLNKIPTLSSDFEGKVAVKKWLICLNKLKASDELDDDQVRQLIFDLENAHNLFYRSLSK